MLFFNLAQKRNKLILNTGAFPKKLQIVLFCLLILLIGVVVWSAIWFFQTDGSFQTLKNCWR